MYKIIGADQKTYGPISSEQIRQWIAEGRANAQTQVQAEGSDEWKRLADFPEFASALGINLSSPPPFSTGAVPAAFSPEEILGRDYTIDIGGCISRGWKLLTAHFGLLFVGCLIYLVVEFAIAGLGAIPFIGPLFSLANLFIVGPLMAGIYYLCLRAIRQQPASAGDVFIGFRTAFLNLFLGYLIPTLFVGLCFIPTLIVALVTMLPTLLHHQQPAPGQVLILIATSLVCLIPAIFLSTNWLFTLPLVLDKGLAFWPAMKLSWKRVTRHWWQVFALLMVAGLINIVGFALCCVGLLVSFPLTMAALMYAYEEMFSRRTA